MTDQECIEWPGLRERAGLLALSLHMLAVSASGDGVPLGKIGYIYGLLHTEMVPCIL